MGFMDKMKDLVGITDEYDDDYDITQEEIEAYKRELSGNAPTVAAAATPEPPLSTGISPLAFSEVAPPQRFAEKPETVDKASRNDSGAFRMVVIEPKNIEECRKLIDNLRNNKPVIINLEKVETDLARKMFDFLSGATYALRGNIQRINQNIYLFAPRNVNIKAMVDRTTESGKPATESPWK
ncbi:MAG: cell division protein SepF [Mogibacterium sp.]|nr:cell division protein SepF [Mogibacterium sp.]MBR0469377.1 cell division protein SepF [Mogibacterium sp.]